MRRRIMMLAGGLGFAAASLTGPAFAQMATETPPAVTKFIAQQPADQQLAGAFLGRPVHNASGEVIGDIKDLVFDRKGQISAVVIGAGGFLGIGEKSVGILFEALTSKTDAKGEPMIVVALTKEALVKAPEFKSREKAAHDKAAKEK